MSLAPALDDRRFQDLVDEAKRRLAGRCPEWTDHNVSDPGVMLIELFADMVDQLIFRLNQVPDRQYLKFLELIGVRPDPAAAAVADVTFWLVKPQPSTVRVERGTVVASRRTESEPGESFTVQAPREIPPVALESVNVGGLERPASAVAGGDPFACFSEPPEPGDAFELRLSAAVPGCAVRLDLACDPAYGRGVDPERPPLVWEAGGGGGWRPCETSDTTGGLNRSGEVVVHVPPEVGDDEPTRLRCRVVAAPDRPMYERSPRISGLRAATVGGTARARHGELVEDEVIGVSDGHPAQRFRLARAPAAAPDERGIVVVSRHGGEEQEWEQRPHFAQSGEHDRHVVLEPDTGVVAFGPALRLPDSDRPDQRGAVPPAGAQLRVRAYWTGGGEAGNLGRGALSILKSSVPFVARVENRGPATGGVRAESLEELKQRGPIELRTLERAVTAEDYERFAKQASPKLARVRCLPVGDREGEIARVLLVPRVGEDVPIDPARLEPPEDVVAAVRRELDRRRVIGARFTVLPARYRHLRIDALVRVLPGHEPEDVERRSRQALHDHFHPTRGGSDGTGWRFGRDVYSGMAYLVLQRVTGVELVQELRLYPIDPENDQPADPVQRIALEPDMLVLSRAHTVAALREVE